MTENYQHICPMCGDWFIRTMKLDSKPIKEQDEFKLECSACKYTWPVKKTTYLERRAYEIKILKERAK